MSEQIKDGGAVDVLEELAHWCNENGIGRDKYARRSATYAAVAELIEFKRIAMQEFEYLQSRRDFPNEDRERWAALANVGPQ